MSLSLRPCDISQTMAMTVLCDISQTIPMSLKPFGISQKCQWAQKTLQYFTNGANELKTLQHFTNNSNDTISLKYFADGADDSDISQIIQMSLKPFGTSQKCQWA